MIWKLHKVFISSTFRDLIAERKKVIDAILFMNCMPVAMEFFPASDEEPVNLIKRFMEDCDYYILIVKGEYGSSLKGRKRSYTEMEYDYATKNRIPILAFMFDSGVKPNEAKEDTTTGLQQKLQTFINKARVHTTKGWASADTLAEAIIASLRDQMIHMPRPGFVKELSVEPVKIKTVDEIAVQEEKIGYIKFMHLSRRDAVEGKPLFKRFIPRLKKNIDVYDELILISTNAFNEEISGFQRADYSSGVVDFDILHPWQPAIINREGVQQEGSLIQTFIKSSNVFLTATYFFNSFQANQSFTIKMEKFTKEATLIFDFSFLPDHAAIINYKEVKAWVDYFKTNKRQELEVQTKVPVYDRMVDATGIYWVKATGLDKEDSLIFDFSTAINWNVIV